MEVVFQAEALRRKVAPDAAALTDLLRASQQVSSARPHRPDHATQSTALASRHCYTVLVDHYVPPIPSTQSTRPPQGERTCMTMARFASL